MVVTAQARLCNVSRRHTPTDVEGKNPAESVFDSCQTAGHECNLAHYLRLRFLVYLLPWPEIKDVSCAVKGYLRMSAWGPVDTAMCVGCVLFVYVHFLATNIVLFVKWLWKQLC